MAWLPAKTAAYEWTVRREGEAGVLTDHVRNAYTV
jgi:hypothetical protein